MLTNTVHTRGGITRRRAFGDRGASAVEFALIVPVLVLFVLGIIELSLLFNAQISVTNAAREGAREMAITNSVTAAQARAVASAPGVRPVLTTADVKVEVVPSAGGVAVSPVVCARNRNAAVTVTKSVKLLFFTIAGTPKLTGKGVMRCGA